MKIRTRIALSLSLCLLIAGAVVLLVNEAAIESAIYGDYRAFQEQFLGEIGVSREVAEAYLAEHPEVLVEFDAAAPIFEGGRSLNDIFRDVQLDAQRDEIGRTRTYTALGIAVIALGAGIVGWLIARRVLRPARRIAERARAASAADLSQRVALEGPNDEMKELSNTFDEMLERLERSFTAQRRFAAQASHELRTPLSLIRAETDLLAQSAPDDAPVQDAVRRIRDAELRAESLVSTLLALSRAESGNMRAVDLRLDEVVGEVVAEAVRADVWETVRVDLSLEDADIVADRQIVECLVANLLDNAARHRRGDADGSWAKVEVATTTDQELPYAWLRVTNPADPADVATMRAILEQGDASGASSARGNGIGLTVVDLIARSLGGGVVLEAADGTVAVTVRIPTTASVTARSLVASGT